MQVQPVQKHLAVSEAAAKLGVSAATLRRWEREGRYTPHRTLGNQRYFAPEDIEALAQGKPFHHQNGHIVSISKDDKQSQTTATIADVSATAPQTPPLAPTTPSRYLSLGEAANFLGVAPSQLRLWEAQGKISPIYTLSGCRQYSLNELEKLATPSPSPAPVALAAAIPVVSDAATLAPVLPIASPPPSFPVVRLGLTIVFILFASFGLLAGGIFVASRFSPSSLADNLRGRLTSFVFGDNLLSPTPSAGQEESGFILAALAEKLKETLSSSFLAVRDSSTVDFKVFFSEGIEVGTDTLTIDSTGKLTTSEPVTITDISTSSLEIGGGMIAGTGNVSIIDRSGRIPALTSTYIADLDATKLTGKIDNADHLDGIDSSSFLRSNESDTAEGAINFTAKPGSTGVGGGPVYVNPAAATSNYTLFGVALNTSSRFRVDAEGDTSIAGTLGAEGATTLSSSLAVTGNSTLTGDLAVNGGDLTTTATSFNLVNATATTVNFAGAATTLSIGASTGTTTVNNALAVTGASTFTGNLTVDGRPTFTKAPTSAHTGTWATGSTTWNQSDATIYINPASATADSNLLGVAVGGSVKFDVDAEGDIYGRNLILEGSTSSGSTTIAGDLSVEGNTTLGDTTTDTLTVNPATFTWAGGNKTLDLTGTATRTLTLLNSTASQVADLNLSDGDLQLGGTVRISNAGAGTLTTLDTGQGANELYDMNQNVQTTDDVTFAIVRVSTLLDVNEEIDIDLDATDEEMDLLSTLTDTTGSDYDLVNLNKTSVVTDASTDTYAGSVFHATLVNTETSGVITDTTNLIELTATTNAGWTGYYILAENASGTDRFTVDASGNLAGAGTLTVSGASITASSASLAIGGALSGATTVTGSGNINTTGGALQTNSVTRIDNSGNVTGGTVSTSALTVTTTSGANVTFGNSMYISVSGAQEITVFDNENNGILVFDETAAQ